MRGEEVSVCVTVEEAVQNSAVSQRHLLLSEGSAPSCLYYSFFLFFLSINSHIIPFPLYTSSPLGPLKSMLSPIAMLSRY